MQLNRKKYFQFHLFLLPLPFFFGLYAFLTARIFPNGFFHCAMHDLFHLYCPFCGGTRAFSALLDFRIGTAFRMNPAIFIGGAELAITDLCLLILLLKKDSVHFNARIPLGAFLIEMMLFTAARNTALLFGWDRMGDLLPYWQGKLPFPSEIIAGLCFFGIACAFCVSLLSANSAIRHIGFFVCAELILLLIPILTRKKYAFLPLALFTFYVVFRAVCRKRKRRGDCESGILSDQKSNSGVER